MVKVVFMMENPNLEVYYVVKIIADKNGIDEELISKIENYGDVKVNNKLIEIVTDPVCAKKIEKILRDKNVKILSKVIPNSVLSILEEYEYVLN